MEDVLLSHRLALRQLLRTAWQRAQRPVETGMPTQLGRLCDRQPYWLSMEQQLKRFPLHARWQAWPVLWHSGHRLPKTGGTD